MGSVAEHKVQPGDTWLEASESPDGRFRWNGGRGGCIRRPQPNRHTEFVFNKRPSGWFRKAAESMHENARKQMEASFDFAQSAEQLRETLAQPNFFGEPEDPYKRAAAQKFNVAYEDVTEGQRRWAKQRAYYYAYSGRPPKNAKRKRL